MRINSIQYLRAAAALMVVVYHLQPQLDRMGVRDLPLDWLIAGVDIFFVVSGFIMWWTTRSGSVSPGDFARRRIHRIVPVYWALSVFYVVVLLVAPRLMQTGAFDPAHVAASFLFIPWPHPTVGYMMPLVTPGWTLNYEMFFYAIFALALFAPRGRQLAFVTGFLVTLAAVGLAARPGPGLLAFYTSTLLLEFLFGVWLGVLFERRRLIPAGLAPAVAVIAVVLLVGLHGLATARTRFLFMGLPAMAIVFAAVSWEAQRPLAMRPALLVLGNASYSIYLVHQLALSATGQLWRRLVEAPPWVSAAGFAVAGVSVSAIGGLVCYALLERPLGRLTAPLLRGPGVGRLPEPAPSRG